MAIEELIAGALGGGLVAAVSPVVSQTKERRDVRAEALRRLADVENARWANENTSRKDFRDAAIAFRSAALVAGASRELADRYVDLATVARATSDDAWELHPDPEYGGGVNVVLSDLVRMAAAVNVDHIWHPHRLRPFVRRDLKRIDQAKQEAIASTKGKRVNWEARRWFL